MKNHAPVGVVLVVFASITWLAATGFAEEKSGKAGKTEIKDEFIVVHPGTKLSKADVKALNDVLKQYDKSLYKIEVYKHGKVTKTLGTLKEMYIDQKVVADLAQAKKEGQSERAIQLIAPSAGPQKGGNVNPVSSVSPQAAVNPVGGVSTPGGTVNPIQRSPSPGGGVNPVNVTPSPGTSVSPVTGSPIPGATVNPQTSGSSTNPQRSTTDKQTAEFLQRLKPILEKYSQ